MAGRVCEKHEIDKRLARWLLLAHERVNGAEALSGFARVSSLNIKRQVHITSLSSRRTTTAAKTPPDVIAKLNAAFVEITKSKEAVTFFRTIGGAPFASTPEELNAFVISETAKWATFVEVGGIEKQ